MEKEIIISYKIKYERKRYLGVDPCRYRIECFDSPTPCSIPEDYAASIFTLFLAQLSCHSRPFSITLESRYVDQEAQDES